MRTFFFTFLSVASLLLCRANDIHHEIHNIRDLHFRTVSPEGGFYYDGISSIIQDDSGYIWIVMANEVYRFDGYNYKRYYPHFNAPQNTGKLFFESIGKDSAGNLFITSNNGLFLYDSHKDEFNQVFPQHLNRITQDHRGNLWIFGENLIGILNNEYWTYRSAAPAGHPILRTNAIHVFEDYLFSGTAQGEVYTYDYDKKEFRLLCKLPATDRIVDIKSDHQWVWALTQNSGLYKISLQTGSVEKEYKWFCTQNNQYVPAKTIHLERNHRIWIGTQRGLYIMDIQTERYIHYAQSKTDEFSLPNSSIWTIYEDSQQNLWIGTYSGGLSYVNFRENSRFRNYFFQDRQLNHNVVSSFAEEKDYIWIGTEGGGLNRMNKKTGEFSYFKHDQSGSSLSYDNVKSIVLDHHRNLWIGMYMAGLDRLDQDRKTFRNYTNTNHSNYIRKLVLEGDSGLWIANQSNADISFYSFAEKRFYNYDIDALYSSRISDICRGKDGGLWIAKEGQLLKMDAATRHTRQINCPQLNTMQIETLCTDDAGDIWLGTVGSGLIRYNEAQNTADIYNDILKHNISAIFSLCIDDGGNPWIGTDNGLFKFDRATALFYRFDRRDGIQGSVFNPKACMKGMNGELYFGGTNGFTIVYPDKVTLNHFIPTARITDFYIDNLPVTETSGKSPLSKPVNLVKQITLNHNNSNFGFQFSSDNYLIPEKNRFRYRLRGYDNRWIETNAGNRIASYTKVPPGEYTFEVLAANNDGIWNEVPASIYIRRLPAPWQSWWAYTLYGLFTVGIFGFIIFYYYNRKKIKLERYMDGLEMQRKEDMHQAQLRFFTNISHEFRTPLFLMTSSLEKLKESGLSERYFNLFNNNTHRLLELINELMEFRTVENGKMKLRLSTINVNELVRRLAADFREYAALKDVTFEVVTDPLLDVPLPVDPKLLEKMVLNLLNNAFKFTRKEGVISIRTYFDITHFHTDYAHSHHEGGEIQSGMFGIVVSDTGIGITPESIANVFTRFYKVDTSDSQTHIGSGIGLALVKGIALLHKGAISISSERNKGADFLIALHRSEEVYSETDFITADQAESPLQKGEYSIYPEETANEPDDTLIDEIVPRFRVDKRILLVEDNENVRSVIHENLSPHYDVVEASNGVEAIELLDQMEVDLILSDVMMPLKDGTTLCREVKSNINTSHIPFIMLTAKSGLENRLEGVESGADAYFEKPVNIQLLIRSIQNIFRRQQQLKEHYAKNYFADSSELSTNKQDNEFMKKLTEAIDAVLDQSDIDVHYIASQLSMSRSKLYSKVKTMTGKSIVEFIRSYRLRKAARLLIEENFSIMDAMTRIGIESNSYFTRAFKAEFGMTPSAFIQSNKK